jgi:hypothetical protein
MLVMDEIDYAAKLCFVQPLLDLNFWVDAVDASRIGKGLHCFHASSWHCHRHPSKPHDFSLRFHHHLQLRSHLNMPSVTDARAFNSSYKPSTAGSSSTSSTPVAVVVGGTAGIGAGIAGALASSFKGDVDVYIIGRNEAAGQAVLDSLPLPPPSQDGAGARRPIRDFIPCDAWLMRDVARTTAELKTTKGVDKINYLVMSPGIMTLQGQTESDEGIDQKLALHYYARWKFAYE